MLHLDRVRSLCAELNRILIWPRHTSAFYQLVEMNLFAIQRSLEEEGIILMFKGFVTPSVTTSILSVVEQRLDEVENDTRLRKRVFNIMVECLDNLFHHIDTVVDLSHTDPMKRSSTFAVRATDNGYTISTGNYLDIEHVEILSHKLNAVHGLEQDELKNYYRNVLQDEGRSRKGGAGLGIVDIARRSNNRLDYTFDIVSKQLAYFSLCVRVEKST